MRTQPAEASARQGGLAEIARVFLKLGFLAFGGPAAHTAMMQDELVRRRKWLSEEAFLDAVAAVQVVPGPNSTELAIHMGQHRAGFKGLLVAGFCFIVPAVLVILPLAIAYVAVGRMSDGMQAALETVMHSVSAAVLAVILVAGVRLLYSAVKGPFGALMVGTALVLAIKLPDVFRVYDVATAWRQTELIILGIAAIAGILAERTKAGSAALAVVVPIPVATADGAEWLRLMGFFLKVGGTLFGSGYVLVNYLETGLTETGLGWLTQTQVLDAVAVGQVTPGPLLTTSTFAGYVIGSLTFDLGIGGSIATALLATAAMFAPAFLFVALLGPLLGRLRKQAWAKAMLAAMGAAAVGLIFAVCVDLAPAALAIDRRPDIINLIIAGLTLFLMLRMNLNATWLIAAALMVGVARCFV